MRYLMFLMVIVLSGCTSARTIGNNETHFLEPEKCGSVGTIERDGTCYKRTIISAKSDAHVIITKENGAIYDVDNVGGSSFAHDLATTVQAIVLQKALDEE